MQDDSHQIPSFEENLFPRKPKEDWIAANANEDSVDTTWDGLDDVDLECLDTDPRQKNQKAAVALVLDELLKRQGGTSHDCHGTSWWSLLICVTATSQNFHCASPSLH